jgi:hypothetical protein
MKKIKKRKLKPKVSLLMKMSKFKEKSIKMPSIKLSEIKRDMKLEV